MWDAIIDALIDSIKLLPFLFVAYLLMEYLEHKTSEKAKNMIKQSGKFGPVIGAVLGVFPQCGFSAAASNLYAGRIISLGTLIAIFLSTSDEMLPILISEQVEWTLILQLLGIKLVIGMIAGVIIDFLIRMRRKNQEEEEYKIVDMCEHDHCHCEEGIVKSAFKHTINIFFFILVITLIINSIIFFIGEERIAHVMLNQPVLGPVVAGLIGLIPNCAASVIITQLYLQGILSMAPMISGLLVGAGVGLVVLFKVNHNIKENIKIIALLYGIGVLSGMILGFLMNL